MNFMINMNNNKDNLHFKYFLSCINTIGSAMLITEIMQNRETHSFELFLHRFVKFGYLSQIYMNLKLKQTSAYNS